MTISRSVPLSALTHTALAMDKDMIFGEDMYIRIQVAPWTQIGFTSTSAADPAAGVAALTVAPKVRNFQLQLAHQVDPDLEAAVRNRFQQGHLKFMIPYVYGWRNATLGAGVANIQIQLNNQLGKKLKRILHVPFLGSEATRFTYDHQNVNGDKIVQYQTMLDSQPLQDYQLSCLQPVAGGARGMDDFRENSPLLHGSAIQGSASYYLNWLHVDSWSQPKRDVSVPEENIDEGLDLTLAKSWGISATTTDNLVHYTFGEFIREVHSLPQGLQIVV